MAPDLCVDQVAGATAISVLVRYRTIFLGNRRKWEVSDIIDWWNSFREANVRRRIQSGSNFVTHRKLF